MTVRPTIQVHFDDSDVKHKHVPGSYSTLEIGEPGTRLALFFRSAAQVKEVMGELGELHAEMEAGAEPSYVVNWCPSETVLDGETLYCDRAAAHSGSHHAPGPDEDSEVMWSDEAAAAAS